MAKDYVVEFTGKDNLSSTINQIKNELKSVGDSSENVDKIAEKFNKIKEGTAPLKRQLRDLSALMSQMNMDGLTNTSQFTEIAQYAGQVKDAIGDAQQAMKAYSSDTAKLDMVTTGFQGLAGALSVATGAMSLFGIENEEVAQAILKVQSAMAILNGIQAVANAFNKDSAFMLGLQSMLMRTNSTATVENAAAKTANAGATATATASQTAFNAAVLANPYVLAAAALATLVAGIVIYANSVDDATDSQIAMNAAVDAFNEVADTHMNKAAEQIQLYDKLKQQYDTSGKKVDDFAKKLIANTAVQRKLGITVKTVDDVHRIFSNNTKTYAAAATARATAMAIEAAKATMLGKALAALSQIYAKLRAGQEVNWRDIQAIYESVGYSAEQAEKLMKEAKFGKVSDSSFFGGYADALGGDLQKSIEHIMNGPALTALSKKGEEVAKSFGNIDSINFDKLLDNNFDALSDSAEKTSKSTGHITKNVKNAKNEVKNTNNEIKKVLTSLEGCDAIIDEANKKKRNLDKKSPTYNKDLETYNKVILGARASKLLLIDNSTMKGLMQTRRIIQEILSDLKPGTKEYERWNEKLDQANEKVYEMAKKLSLNGDMQSLKEARAALEAIIATIPAGSKKWKELIAVWRELNGQITSAEKHLKYLKEGIEKGSIVDLQEQVKEIDIKLNTKNLDKETRESLNSLKDVLNDEIMRLQKGVAPIELPLNITYVKEGSYEELQRSAENARTIIQDLQRDYENGIIDKVALEQSLDVINKKLLELNLKPIKLDIQADWEKFAEGADDALSKIQSITSTVDAFAALNEKLEEGADAWEIFKTAVSAVQSAMQTFTSIMEIVNAIQEAHNLKTLASIAGKNGEAVANETAAAAAGTKAAADGVQAAEAAATIPVLKAEESALLDLAAAQIFAAHAAIPFAGAGLASGFITQMMATMTAQHAASLSLTAFKDGGIVGGNNRMYEFPILAHTGEMVLNEHQQKNLFDAIDNGEFGSGTSSSITFKLKGSDIYGSLKNFTKIKSKTSSIKSI